MVPDIKAVPIQEVQRVAEEQVRQLVGQIMQTLSGADG